MACADCTKGTIHAGTPAGKETTLGGLQSYVTGDANAQRIIVFGTDVFGWRLPNARILADEYAARNFYVVVPDLFGGRDLPRWTLSASEHTDKPTWKQRLLRPLLLFLFIPFLLRNRKAAQEAKLTGLLAHLRAARPGAKIGMAGFCWGGRFAVTLNPRFDATFAAHPSRLRVPDELRAVARPLSLAVAEEDNSFDRRRAEEAEALLRGRGFNDLEVVVYQGVHHGWTVRTDMSNPEKKARRDQARDQALDWFEKHLTVAST